MAHRRGEYNPHRDFGCTVTFADDDGKKLTLTRSGSAREAFRALVKIALAKNDRYRVLCVSTPNSILGDLRGRKTGGYMAQRHAKPEAEFINKAGLPLELLHPSLLAAKKHR